MKDMTDVFTIVKKLAQRRMYHVPGSAYLVASVTLVILGLIKRDIPVRVIPMAHVSQNKNVIKLV